MEIDYYMIGALARQAWYEKVNLKFRTTKDVDYAALIGSHEEYQKVKDHLIEKEGYSESKENAFVLITPEEIQVDILPFGEREIHQIVDTNERFLDRLVSMINRYVADSDKSDFIRLMVKEIGM